jgi:hypothetical protein
VSGTGKSMVFLYVIEINCYQLKLSCYNDEIFYIRLIATQKIKRKESKHITIKLSNHKRRQEERSKVIHINFKDKYRLNMKG